jgi:hypothetical protein
MIPEIISIICLALLVFGILVESSSDQIGKLIALIFLTIPLATLVASVLN